MLNVEMQTYTYTGSAIVQIYYTILADIVRHMLQLSSFCNLRCRLPDFNECVYFQP